MSNYSRVTYPKSGGHSDDFSHQDYAPGTMIPNANNLNPHQFQMSVDIHHPLGRSLNRARQFRSFASTAGGHHSASDILHGARDIMTSGYAASPFGG